MREYDFEVIICSEKCDGCVTVEASDKDDAINKAIKYVGDKLYEALPELDIEYGVNFIEDDEYKKEENKIKNDKDVLTKEEAVRLHRELWNKIAELIKENGIEKYDYNIDKIKKSALEELGYDPKNIYEYCWCCEYNNEHGGYRCKRCPVEWDNIICSESEFGEFWYAVEDEESEELAYNIAIKIANLPEREDV